MSIKIKLILLSILLAFSFSSKEDKVKTLDLMEGVNLELYYSNVFTQTSVMSTLKFAFLGDYKENSQLYFTYGAAAVLPIDVWEIAYFGTPIGLFHRTNFANSNMFLDYGVEGDIFVSLSDYSMSSYLSPELAMGIKIPIKKNPEKKLILRVSFGYNLLGEKLYLGFDKYDDEEEEEEDWMKSYESYPFGLNVKVDFGINKIKKKNTD